MTKLIKLLLIVKEGKLFFLYLVWLGLGMSKVKQRCPLNLSKDKTQVVVRLSLIKSLVLIKSYLLFTILQNKFDQAACNIKKKPNHLSST